MTMTPLVLVCNLCSYEHKLHTNTGIEKFGA